MLVFTKMSNKCLGWLQSQPTNSCSKLTTEIPEIYSVKYIQGWQLTLLWRRPLSYRDQWTGFYMITASVMKELNTRPTSGTSFWCLYQLWTYFKHYPGVLIVDCEQVSTGCVEINVFLLNWVVLG